MKRRVVEKVSLFNAAPPIDVLPHPFQIAGLVEGGGGGGNVMRQQRTRFCRIETGRRR